MSSGIKNKTQFLRSKHSEHKEKKSKQNDSLGGLITIFVNAWAKIIKDEIFHLFIFKFTPSPAISYNQFFHGPSYCLYFITLYLKEKNIKTKITKIQ